MPKRYSYSFNTVPRITRPRTTFKQPFAHTTSMNIGRLQPVYFKEVLPGDTFKVPERHVVRTTSPYIVPVMDNLYLDMWYFFVPLRQIYNGTAEVFGENKKGAWAPQEETTMPFLTTVPRVRPSDNSTIYGSPQTVQPGSIGDYLGMPVGNIGLSSPGSSGPTAGFQLSQGQNIADLPTAKGVPLVSVLPFRAFAHIWNEWFRDENTQQPVAINLGDVPSIYVPSSGGVPVLSSGASGTIEYLNDRPWSPVNYTGLPPVVNKYKDYFTSAFIAPQKGDAVTIGTFGQIPLIAGTELYNLGGAVALSSNSGSANLRYPLYIVGKGGSAASGVEANNMLVYDSTDTSEVSMQNSSPISYTNLVADGSQASAINVNEYRVAFQSQKPQRRQA